MPLIEIEDDHLVTQVGDIVPAEMDDEDLRDCMGMLCVEGSDIREQLADPTRADEIWRIRAQDALRHRIREFELCRVEAIRRGMRNLPDINFRREKARLDRVARFESSMMRLSAQQAAREDRKITVLSGTTPGQLRHAELMLELHRQKERSADAKMRRQVELQRADSERFKGIAALFVSAAKTVLTKEQRAEIWVRAREMFPDDPCWRENRDSAASVQTPPVSEEKRP